MSDTTLRAPLRGWLSALDEAPDEVLAAAPAEAHGESEALLHDVVDALGKLVVEAHLRMARGEGRDRRSEVARAESCRAGEAQRAAWSDRRRRDSDLGFHDIGEELDAALEERLSCLGEREPTRRPVQKPRIEMRLEVGDEARHGRHGNVEARGGPREAARFDDAGKSGQGLEAIHRFEPRLLHISQQYFILREVYP